MDAGQIEALIPVHHKVPEAGGASETIRQFMVEKPRVTKLAECVRIRTRRRELEVKASRDGEVDRQLERLPEVQDDGVGGIGAPAQLIGGSGQSRCDTVEVPLDRGGSLGQGLAVECGHGPSDARFAS